MQLAGTLQNPSVRERVARSLEHAAQAVQEAADVLLQEVGGVAVGQRHSDSTELRCLSMPALFPDNAG